MAILFLATDCWKPDKGKRRYCNDTFRFPNSCYSRTKIFVFFLFFLNQPDQTCIGVFSLKVTDCKTYTTVLITPISENFLLFSIQLDFNRAFSQNWTLLFFHQGPNWRLIFCSQQFNRRTSDLTICFRLEIFVGQLYQNSLFSKIFLDFQTLVCP